MTEEVVLNAEEPNILLIDDHEQQIELNSQKSTEEIDQYFNKKRQDMLISK